MHAKDEEIAALKVQNLDLNKRLLNIAEATKHPLVERFEKMLDTKMEALSSSIYEKLLGRRSMPRATGPSSEQGGEVTTAGVSQEIPVSSEAETHQGKRVFASSSSKIDFSNVASALSLPLIVTRKEGKQPMTTEEMSFRNFRSFNKKIK